MDGQENKMRYYIVKNTTKKNNSWIIFTRDSSTDIGKFLQKDLTFKFVGTLKEDERYVLALWSNSFREAKSYLVAYFNKNNLSYKKVRYNKNKDFLEINDIKNVKILETK